ncbi:anti-sigma factor C-terminal domain-containing protein, partial [Enterococcus faecalis]
KNELSELDKMENQVAEVAISFDKPYPYEEVRKMLPSNINLVWLYVYSETVNEAEGPSGTLPYGFQLSMDDHNEIFDPENNKQHFFETLEKSPLFADNQEGQKFIQQNKNKKVEKLPIWGVMLTGQTKNFKALQNEPFVRGASIGVTAPIVPYIQPEK